MNFARNSLSTLFLCFGSLACAHETSGESESEVAASHDALSLSGAKPSVRLVAVSASAYDLVIAGSFSACVSSGLPQVSEIRLTHPRGQFHRTPGALDVKVADLGDLFLCHAVADFPAEFRLRLDVSTATLPVPAQIQQLSPHASADYAVVVDGQTLGTLYAGATGALDYVAAPTGTSSSGTSTPDCRRRIIPCEE